MKLPSAEELRKALASLDIKLERLLLFCSQNWCAQNEERRQGKPCYTASLFPPITGMKVYDLEKCAACVVSEDCGAWWPEEQRQKVREIQLK
ncbi:Cysteine dioxygenase Dlit [Cytobacillus firmus]|uniref:Cysteine dioxygenase Dlit n=1 Tax=Cytobacillus firmus TaxID=1399 RepID=A0A800NEL2_CYTFI|nr:hypothetical protein [Cytobacillus firmus]KAF0825367.1 Cysteine dioxygenase Dlit [Cytobacillus firmus]